MSRDDELPFDELDPCCQREILERRRYNEVSSQLRRVDRSELRHDARNGVLLSRSQMEQRRFNYCQSCAVNSDYRALSELRQKLESERQEEEACGRSNGSLDEACDDDSDDEFLREFEEEDRLHRQQREEQAQLHQEHLRRAELVFGLGQHREETLEHLCSIAEEERRQRVGTPLLLHVYCESNVSAVIDLSVELLASSKVTGLRCRRLQESKLWEELDLSRASLCDSALFRALQNSRDLRRIRGGDGSVSVRGSGEPVDREGTLLCFSFKEGLGHELCVVLRESEVFAETVGDTAAQLLRALDRAGVAAVTLPVFKQGATAADGGESDLDDGEGFDCGVPGCGRRYPHEHVSGSKPSFAAAQERMQGGEALASNAFTRL